MKSNAEYFCGKILKWIAAVAVMLTASGCLWICRVPFPLEKRYSDDGECTNCVWRSMVEDCRIKSGTGPCTDDIWWSHGVYPTIKMRIHIWNAACSTNEVDETQLTGEDRYNRKWQKRMFPFVYCLTWLASPIDAVVDTILLPYDLLKE